MPRYCNACLYIEVATVTKQRKIKLIVFENRERKRDRKGRVCINFLDVLLLFILLI